MAITQMLRIDASFAQLVGGHCDLGDEGIHPGLLLAVAQARQAVHDRAVCRDEVVHQFAGGYIGMTAVQCMDEQGNPVAEVPGGENL